MHLSMTSADAKRKQTKRKREKKGEGGSFHFEIRRTRSKTNNAHTHTREESRDIFVLEVTPFDSISSTHCDFMAQAKEEEDALKKSGGKREREYKNGRRV